jgi:archaellum component FlaC
MEVRIISEQEVRDIVLSILSEEMNSELWCEDGSIRMDIRRLKPSDGINSHAIDDLYERVKTLENNIEQLKKITGWCHGYDDHNWDLDESLSKRVGKLEKEVEKL